jgi:4-hydroxybenzoate polyprenyltransferase
MERETIVANSGLAEGKVNQLPPPELSELRVPLVVDLDGTLAKTDLLIESLVVFLKDNPAHVFALPFWLLKGMAHFKKEIARRISFDAGLIPYRPELLEYLKTQRANGRVVVLATASDERIARQVADHLGLFDSVLASDGTTNLSGERKRERLVNEFGEKGFDYVANGSRDMEVWPSARKAVVLNPNPQFARAVERVTPVRRVFEVRRAGLGEYLKALRPLHWLKNFLVFVPLFTAHRFNEPALLARDLLALISFCLCASGGYLFNDLFDLPADRRHPQKRLRPFAAGRLPLSYALAMIPVLVMLGGVLGVLVSWSLSGMLLLYVALALTYSMYIKKIVLLDVIVLAGLYTLRIMAGSAAVAIWPSEWLLAFSMFLFLSLAFVKRYDELVVMRSVDGDQAKARNYEISDAELLASKGTASGYMAVLVLALYINSATAKTLYGRHELIWALCPLLLYWVGRMWLVAHRGQMRDDPVVFALRDRTSRILILLMLGTALLAM